MLTLQLIFFQFYLINIFPLSTHILMNVFHYLAITGNRGVDKISLRLKRLGSPGMALSCPVLPVFSGNTLKMNTNVKLK